MQPDIQLIIIGLAIPILWYLYLRIRLKRLAYYQSPINGKVEVFERYNKEKVLTINSVPQGITINNPTIVDSYWYKVAQLTCHFCQLRHHPQTLMVGLGANTIPNLIAHQNGQIHQTIIEIDPIIIQVCQDLFGLDKLPNHRIIQGDAFKILTNNHKLKTKFDLIIIDIFLGDRTKTQDQNFLQFPISDIIPHLKSDGMVIFNRPAHTNQSVLDNQQLERQLKSHFQKTEIVSANDPRGYHNQLVIGQVLKSQRSRPSGNLTSSRRHQLHQ